MLLSDADVYGLEFTYMLHGRMMLSCLLLASRHVDMKFMTILNLPYDS